ncbi:Mor transcription activator family protein [Thalassomonas actiniarum]|uniref:Mor transcription activator domain-containing protein n=1 Tax=Thalassomonas actiniarum TaxID=485447 RepID=A0AAF0C5N4_9GAMM|nr:Mor transcription activator family protein [Thalassomonas actiniarum]WDE01154.1 hypothetical protein SG35_011250 [Thalassomonas actiniarum]
MTANNPQKNNSKKSTRVCEQELLDVIGVNATLALERAFSASYLYIPARAPSKAIINAVGLTAAMKLVDHFGCGDIWVPKSLLTKYRNISICEEKDQGKTLPELAQKFKTGIPNIRRILKQKGIQA